MQKMFHQHLYMLGEASQAEKHQDHVVVAHLLALALQDQPIACAHVCVYVCVCVCVCVCDNDVWVCGYGYEYEDKKYVGEN